MSESEWMGLEDFPSTADVEAYYAGQNGQPQPLQAFTGLSHAEVLALEFPPERMLVKDLVPIGAVGTIAGVPETFKSWQAQRLAVMVGSGEGEMFGKGVEHSGPVGYFWQDDSTREEAERIKLYEKVRDSAAAVDVRWFLNEGLRLPDELARLRHTIVEYRFVLIVLDSFYNVLFGMDLKDEGAEQVIARLKSEVCDVTGCTVLIVDHMPWATDVNRGRLRSYGGVFKSAATRFGIYIDAVGNKLWVEARGNNIVGFKRTLASWNEEKLEMCLIDAHEAVDEGEYEQRILDELELHQNGLTTDQMNEIKGTKSQLVSARRRLLDTGRVTRRKDRTSFSGYVWYLAQTSDKSGSAQLDLEEPQTGSADVSNQFDPNTPRTAQISGESGSIGQTNQSELPNWFGGSTGSPLRGDTTSEPVTDTAAIPNHSDEDYDDGIPF